MISTGYFAFVKVLEITGGILVAVSRTRPLGLLTLGRIVVEHSVLSHFPDKGCRVGWMHFAVGAFALFVLDGTRGVCAIAAGRKMTSKCGGYAHRSKKVF